MGSHAPKPVRPDDGSRPPRWLIHVIIISVVASWVPFALIAESRTSKKSVAPFHPFQDMDAQPKSKAQAASSVFADGRAMRPRIDGTIARGELIVDDHLQHGYRTTDEGKPVVVKNAQGVEEYDWIAGYPKQIQINQALLQRGRERFDIYCAPCHGLSGQGNGMVHQRAVSLPAEARAGWVQPSNMSDISVYGQGQYAEGRLFHTIGYGARSMRGYASQINVEDRWAIVAYVRALQLAQNAGPSDVPAEKLEALQ